MRPRGVLGLELQPTCNVCTVSVRKLAGTPHLSVRVALELAAAGALVYSLRKAHKRQTDVATRNASVGDAQRILHAPILPTANAQTADGDETSRVGSVGNGEASQISPGTEPTPSQAHPGSASNTLRRIFFPGWDVILFLGLFIGTGAFAYTIFPEVASVEPLSLEPTISHEAYDQVGPLHLSKLEMWEWHGNTYRTEAPHPDRFRNTGNAFTIEIFGNYDVRSAQGPVTVSFSIDLPRQGAVVTACGSPGDEQEHPPTDVFTDCKVDDEQLKLNITQKFPAEKGESAAIARIAGISGIWFSATSSHADVRLPYIYDSTVYKGSVNCSALRVHASYHMPQAKKWTWSVILPQPVYDDYADWDYVYTGDKDYVCKGDIHPVRSEALPSPITGIRNDVIEDDTNKVFIAGALLGIAGGSLLGAFQAGVAIIQRKQDQQRHARN
jgi:hypothetical protein